MNFNTTSLKSHLSARTRVWGLHIRKHNCQVTIVQKIMTSVKCEGIWVACLSMTNKRIEDSIQWVPISRKLEKIADMAPQSLLKLWSGVANIFKILPAVRSINVPLVSKRHVKAELIHENSSQGADASERYELTHVNFPASSLRVDTVASANRLFCSSAVNAWSTR